MELLSRRTLSQFGEMSNEGASYDFSNFAKKMMKKWGHEEFRFLKGPVVFAMSLFTVLVEGRDWARMRMAWFIMSRLRSERRASEFFLTFFRFSFFLFILVGYGQRTHESGRRVVAQLIPRRAG